MYRLWYIYFYGLIRKIFHHRKLNHINELLIIYYVINYNTYQILSQNNNLKSHLHFQKLLYFSVINQFNSNI